MWKAIKWTCGRTARYLTEYLDGTLSPARRRAVDAHLRGCAGCRHDLESTRRMLSVLTGLPRRELGESFDASLRARLDAVRASRTAASGVAGPTTRLSSLLSRPFLLPAGAVALAALAIGTWRLQPAIEPTSTPRPPAYVQAMVEEHQRLRSDTEASATVVGHNLGSVVLGEGDEE